MPRKPPPERNSLVALIETVEQTYYISQNAARRVDDEGRMDILARIEQINAKKCKDVVGRQIDISLLCARIFSHDAPAPMAEKPFMSGLRIDKRYCGFSAYIPSDAFWALRPLIDSGAITHIEAMFGALYRGSADLEGIHLAPASKCVLVEQAAEKSVIIAK